ncbi:MAG: DUF4235 domain-containing protein [Nesterenkonia sp.]|uniref:DUF4235 domain-containing protein n=1 Tax=Nesterenkonia marinintestina TaxID=2979865 RepID=UPI0021BE654D|nr:DUF4235 domain-containing protein [Nesterenkonia sp. GX14115]MDO5493100.1 DUF4235 domain-containing protein [Nesterenkonia sp.]
MDKLLDKALSTGISIAGGLVATKLFEFTWRQVTGEDAPKNSDDEEFTLKKALVFAVTSAAISATVQVLSQRGAKVGREKIKQAYGKQSEV